MQRPRVLHGRLLGDERLAQDAGAGSEHAFAALFQRYHQQLYRYCRGLTGNDQDAQDALQTAFTKALIALREGRRNAPLRPWLYRIAHNEAITVIRSRSAVLDIPAELEAAGRVFDSVEERERMAMLIADLRELPEQQRGALVMRELSGLSHEEIAAVLQISVGSAKQSILEARRSLLEFQEGRAMACDAVQRIISDDDRRSLRSRRVRAHLRECGACTAFAEAIPRRRADMLALWPVLPAASSAGLLAKITGAGSGHGGGGAGLAAGGAVKGIGATISIKAAAAAGAAVVATAGVGAVAVLHHAGPSQAPLVTHSAAAKHGAAATGHRLAATHTATKHGSPKLHGGSAKHATAGKGSHNSTGSKHTGGNPNGHGHGLLAAPGQSGNHGHTTTHAAAAPGHGSAQASHRKPVKATSRRRVTSTVHRRVKPKHRLKRHKPVRIVRRRPAPTRTTATVRTKSTAATPTRTTATANPKTTTTAKPKTTTVASTTPTIAAPTDTTTSTTAGGGGGQGSATPAGQSTNSMAGGKVSK